MSYGVHPDLINNEADGSVIEKPSQDQIGWLSAETHPPNAQMEILMTYGLHHISNVIYRDSLWSFLKDTSNPNWIRSYQSS